MRTTGIWQNSWWRLPRRRGSALILVMAILGLLAVIGTVYIVASREEQSTARAMSAALNMDLARDAVMNQVRTALYSATVNGEGRVGVIEPNYDLPRFFDYSEHNGGKARDMPDNAVLPNNKHQLTPDQPWLARAIHRASQSDDDICSLPNTTDGLPPANTINNQLNVMGDATPGYVDAQAYLLSYTSGHGERYRFGVRIVDLSRMANLNVGAPDSNSVTDPDGQFLSSYALGDGGAIADSRRNSYKPSFTFSDWQKQLFQMEQPTTGVAFFDAADELEMRAIPFASASNPARPVKVWPALAGNVDRYTAYSFSRDLRLRPTPSVSPPRTRHHSVTIVAPPYTLNPANTAQFPIDCGPFVWPMAPAKVGINPYLDPANPTEALFYLAKAATNIATAMEASKFSAEEARAFAANYLTYRWSGLVADTGVTSGTPAYYFPAGPSFIDDKGICIRATDSSGAVMDPATCEFGGPSDLSATFPNAAASADENGRIYIGFLPQPFLNEVAVHLNNNVQVDDIAIELYNPYPVALSLQGFRLQTDGTSFIDLTGLSIDPNGYLTLVQTQPGGQIGALAALATGSVVPKPLNFGSSGKIILTRKYMPRLHNALDADAEIDEFPCAKLTSQNSAGTYFLRRLNESTKPASPSWEAAIQCDRVSTVYEDTVNGKLTLGAQNADGPNGAVENLIVPLDLSDRYTDDAKSQGGPILGPISLLHNINDFNRIPRICNEIQNPDIASQNDQTRPLTSHLGDFFDPQSPAPSTQPPFTSKTDFPYDAQVHFDFKAPPDFLKDPAHVPVSSDQFPYDCRAIQLFDYLTMLDRVGDPEFDIGNGRIDTHKLRLPGRINVNTADLATLSNVANMQGMAGSIIAYRDRIGIAYPGKGIRTLTELLVPVMGAVNNSPKNLHERDAAWAAIINQCTTRSDSFAVYGYLEAIRANPAVAHDNAADWYNCTSTSSDPHDTSAKNIRVASRRWLAIVDRSWSNALRGEATFELPRVVGIKGLPH